MSDEEYAYLRDDFNPRSLLKEQLRNILLTHNVDYNDKMLKSDLLKLFQEEIVPRRADLRAQFLDVAASAMNIENATPPSKGRKSRPESRPESKPAPEGQESPRARRARSRSPRRVASSSSRKSEDTDVKGDIPQLVDAELPDLKPPSEGKDTLKPPKSPRRRRANRKVEVDKPEPETVDIPAEEIKTKVPRSPRRKRARDDNEEEESFVANNVFQVAKPHAKKRRAHSPAVEAPSMILPTLDNAPVTEADISIDALPLDADFVADLNAEVDRMERSEAELARSYPELSFSEKAETDAQNSITSSLDQRWQTEQNYSNNSILKSEEPREPSKSAPSQQYSKDDVFTPETDTTTRRPASARGTPNRRGFIPSLTDLSVSRAFAEQLEPFLAPSPAPAERNTPAPEKSRESPLRPSLIVVEKPKAPAETRDSSVELPEAEKVAAADIHDMVAHATESLAWRHKLPRLRLPHIRIGRPPLPKIPAIPRPRLPTIAWKSIISGVFKGLVILVSLSVLLLSILLGLWYRDAWAHADFCEVNYITSNVYPDWTWHDTGVPAISSFQASIREFMDTIQPTCVKCPAHARCFQDRVALCDSGYRQSANPLSLWGVWPLPPRCLPDWEAQRKLDVMSERAVSYLREKRAEAVCDTLGVENPDIETASVLRAEELRSRLLLEKSELLSEEEFDNLWQQVVEQLPTKHSDVYVVSFDATSYLEKQSLERGIDATKPASITIHSGQTLTPSQKSTPSDGPHGTDSSSPASKEEINAETLWLASSSDQLVSLKCRCRRMFFVVYLKFHRWYLNHRTQIIMSMCFATGLLAGALYYKRYRAHQRKQKITVMSFVQQLKKQRKLAQEDKSGKTEPYLRAIDLRKQVPKNEFKAIQDALEKVEGVRMRQIEIYGEITRIWEWAP